MNESKLIGAALRAPSGTVQAGEGLIHEGRIRFESTLSGKYVIGVAGNMEYLHFGTLRAKARGQFATAHLRHDHICGQDVNGCEWCLGAPLQPPEPRCHFLLSRRYNHSPARRAWRCQVDAVFQDLHIY